MIVAAMKYVPKVLESLTATSCTVFKISNNIIWSCSKRMWKFDSCLYVIVFENLRIGKTRSGGMGHLRVQPRFLHSNATIHKWALGALAELLGNSLAEVRTGANYVNVDVLYNEKDTHSKMLPEVVSFIKKDGGERIIGARIRDNLSGTEFDTYAKVVVNAGGPFCDSVENLADKDAKLVICPSSGVHIVLPDYYSPEGMGSIIPKTKDGRILFIDSEARLGKRTVQDLNALSQPYFCSSRACLKWSRYRKNTATEWRVSNTC